MGTTYVLVPLLGISNMDLYVLKKLFEEPFWK